MSPATITRADCERFLQRLLTDRKAMKRFNDRWPCAANETEAMLWGSCDFCWHDITTQPGKPPGFLDHGYEPRTMRQCPRCDSVYCNDCSRESGTTKVCPYCVEDIKGIEPCRPWTEEDTGKYGIGPADVGV